MATLTGISFFDFLRLLGLGDIEVEQGPTMRYRRKEGAKPSAESTCMPMFHFSPNQLASQSLEWRSEQFRRDDFPVPIDLDHAGEMAMALAERVGAFAWTNLAEGAGYTFYAIMDFQLLRPMAPTATRDKQMRKIAVYALGRLSKHMIASVQQHGSASAEFLGRDVNDRAEFFLACVRQACLSDPLRDAVAQLAKELQDLSLHAAIPTDEPLLVAGKIAALAKAWR